MIIGTLVLLLVFLLFWFVVVLLFVVGLDDGLVDTTCDEVDEDEVEDDFIIRIIRMIGWLSILSKSRSLDIYYMNDRELPTHHQHVCVDCYNDKKFICVFTIII